jgi:integrase
VLTDTEARTAKPKDKAYKLYDREGLYLFVRPTGSKQWRYDYEFNHKRKTLTIGSYPDVRLLDARRARDDARRSLKTHKDPSFKAAGSTFKAVAEEWLHKLEREGDAPITTEKKRWLLSYAYPILEDRPISQITAPEILQALRKLEAKGKYESARRLRSVISRIFRYAIATARTEHDPTQALAGALTTPTVIHRAALTDPNEVGALMRAIDGYTGHPITRYALQLHALTFVRPGELRAAEWSEIQDTEWRIPGPKMKMKKPHIVPLSSQALRILEELKPLTGHAKYLFPSFITDERCMCENTLNTALRRLGYDKTEMTSHGFRTVASTLLNELGWNADWIEMQLAHKPKDAIRGTYNQAKYLADRKRMMQAWADYLDELRLVSQVAPPQKEAS